MLKDIENELVRYFNIRRREIKEYYQIPKDDNLLLTKVKLNFQSLVYQEYNVDRSHKYYQIPVNFILVTIESYGRKLIYLYLHLDSKMTKIESIETAGGILSREPSFDELMGYIRYCIGLKKKDFKELLNKLKILNVSVV